MPRIRTIKPEFWSDEDIAECSIESRLIAIGLLNFSDSDGYFNANLKIIRSNIFPLDDFSIDQIKSFLCELIDSSYIVIYKSSSGKIYGKIKNFRKHQVIKVGPKGEKNSEIKSLELNEISLNDFLNHGSSTSTVEVLGEYGGSTGSVPVVVPGGKERKGKERKGKEQGKEICEKKSKDILLVFEHWRKVWNKTNASKLDKRRKTLISNALKNYSVDYICESITGCYLIPHNRGETNGKEYSDLGLILRDSDHIEKYHHAFENPPNNFEKKSHENSIVDFITSDIL
jgi:hypothetical protein